MVGLGREGPELRAGSGVHPSTMNRSGSWSKWKRLVWLSALVVGVGAALAVAFCPRTPTAPVLVLRRPLTMPSPLLDRVLRFIPATPSWGWFWRAREVVFGRRKPVNVFTEILALDASRDPAARLAPGAPTFSDPRGLRVWLLGGADIKSLRQRLEDAPGTEVLSRPRVTTADECAASLFQGYSVSINGVTSPVGHAFECYPRVHRQATDLIAAVTLSEAITNAAAGDRPSSISIRTNLDLALRLQIPKGSGAFLLDVRPREAGARQIAVLLDPP